MPFTIEDLTASDNARIEGAANLLHAAFSPLGVWTTMAESLQEVVDSLGADRVSRVAIDAGGKVVGWIGAIREYDGLVWQLHPIVVDEARRRNGIGRALVLDLEAILVARGALTLWAGSDDENGETTLSGRDLYPDIPGAIRNIRNLRRHPYEFYLRLGFRIAGVLPDANGRGKPDIFLAKRVGDRTAL